MPPYELKDYIKHISACVNSYIDCQHITIKSFAVRCGISYEEMRLIVNHKAKDIRISTLIMIADYMNIPLEHLIALNRTKTPEETLLHDMYIKLKAYNEYRL